MYGVAPSNYPAPRRGAGEKVIYLDFDGPLHHHEVYWHPKRGPYLKAPQQYRLFQHAPLLEAVLANHPDVKIVLSTSWVRQYGYGKTVKKLPEGLRPRVIGATFHREMRREAFESLSRGLQILNDVYRRHPVQWVALDDDTWNWPISCLDNLIEVDEVLGLSKPETLSALNKRLEAWHLR